MPNIKQQQLKKLILKQKKALRILFNVKYNSHTSLLFHLSQITKVEKIVEKESILLVHKYFKGDLPDAVTDLINSTKITGCNTRSQTDKIIYTSIKKDEKLTIGKIIEFWNRTNMTNTNKLAFVSRSVVIVGIKALLHFKKVYSFLAKYAYLSNH